MFGIAIGVISSVVIFVFYSRDKRAVDEYKKKKKQEAEKKQKQEEEQLAKIKQQREKIMNDPQLRKKNQERTTGLKKKLFDGLGQNDRKLLEDYLESKRKTGKNDAEIIKEATNKAGMFMILMLVLIVVMVIGIIILTSGDSKFEELEQGFKKVLVAVFPRFAQAPTPTPAQSATTEL